MAHLIDYIWQSSFCLLFFFGIYWCFLRREKVFGFTRVFLLVTPVLALLFPLIEIPVEFSKPTISLENTDFLQYLTAQEAKEGIAASYGLPEVTVESTKLPILLEWKDYLFLGYLTIAILLIFRLLWQFLQLRLLTEKGWYQTVFNLKNSYFLIPTFGLAPVFSFFNRLFWDDSQQLKPEEKAHIIKHEIEHIRQGHSWDMMYYQILSILFWFNPGIHLMRSALIDTHEYSADANVVKQTANKDTYTNLIVKIAFKGLDLPVGNYFIRSTTLKRIMMMKNNKKTNWFKLVMVVPLTAMLLALVSMKTISTSSFFETGSSLSLANMKELIKQAQDTINVSTKVMHIPNPEHYEYVSALKDGKVIAQLGNLQYEIGNISDDEEYADVMGMINIFKHHSSFVKRYDTPELHTTADKMPVAKGGIEEWNKFLSKNLKYPTEARRLGMTGNIYIEFVVSKEGKVLQPTLKRSLGMGLDDEILRIFSLESMPEWNPGIIDGNAVNTLMVLPIRFKLKGEVAKSSSFFDTPSYTPKKEVFDVVEKMPVPKGGMDGWKEYVSNNLTYPQAAQEKGVEGTVYVSFIVDEDGTPQNPKILRGIGSGADEEAMRLVANAPKWTPGQQQGKTVPVEMKVPIKFQLDIQAIGAPKPNQLDDIVVVGYSAVSIEKDRKSRPSKPSINSSDKTEDNGEDPLYIINGEEYQKADISKVSPEDIKSINVLKGESAIEKYEKKGENGAIEITLKEGVQPPKKSDKSNNNLLQAPNKDLPTFAKGEEPIYQVDGVVYKASKVKLELSPKDIKSIEVIKSEEAGIYGSAAKNDIVVITTKNKP
ncbi:M56 family metallopeptidase [Echinicola rosea]|uniref:Cell envelope biogenesis protein TonB n=1 Tax=Echinicola rosea TaxID=1807691 RepID=A0ABQ1UWL5_9BACT|nr:M56 family metallopeptidase [Echinicola rosea]GGF26882.1 cell envelope biogenesis protein TonB [Echinicola rosea]